MGYGVNGVNGLNGGYPGYPVGGAGGFGTPPFLSGTYPPGSDQFVGSGPPKKKGVAGFFQGIVNAAVNTIKSLFTFQGILTMAGAGALVWATGGAALIPLAALGAGMGGFQMLNGLAKGDSEAVGEGFFVTFTSLLGLKYTPKQVTVGDEVFMLKNTASPGQKLGITGRLKALWGGNKFASADGSTEMNIWQIGANKLSSRFKSAFSVSTSPGFNPLKPGTWQTRNDVQNLRTLKMDSTTLAKKYQEAHDLVKESPGDLGKMNAQNKAKADLKYLEELAKRPSKKLWKEYIDNDNQYQIEINDLRLQRFSQQMFDGSEAKLQYLDKQIQGKEASRAQLIDKFRADTAAEIGERQSVMDLINPARSSGDSATSGVSFSLVDDGSVDCAGTSTSSGSKTVKRGNTTSNADDSVISSLTDDTSSGVSSSSSVSSTKSNGSNVTSSASPPESQRSVSHSRAIPSGGSSSSGVSSTGSQSATPTHFIDLEKGGPSDLQKKWWGAPRAVVNSKTDPSRGASLPKPNDTGSVVSSSSSVSSVNPSVQSVTSNALDIEQGLQRSSQSIASSSSSQTAVGEESFHSAVSNLSSRSDLGASHTSSARSGSTQPSQRIVDRLPGDIPPENQ